MIVVDSNVLAYLYLPGTYTAAAEVLLQADPDWSAPRLWRSELRNILLGYVRRKALEFDRALDIQRAAEALMGAAEFEVDSQSVMALARDSGCSAYDCEFVALATRLKTQVVTMDRALLRAFPDVAVPLAAAL